MPSSQVFAGPLTPKGIFSKNGAIDYLYAIHEFNVAYNTLVSKGYAPYNPANDYTSFIVGGVPNRTKEKQIKSVSMEYLEATDAVVLLKGWRKSEGTQAEIKRADELGIPVFNSLRAFLERDDD